MATRDYTKVDKRLYNVPDDKPYYHGTQADEFGNLKPRSHVTSDFKLAKEFAEHGSFLEGNTGGKGRVIELRVGIPDEKAPRIAFTEAFHSDVDKITDDDGNRSVNGLTKLIDEYHDQADADAKKLKTPVYFDGDIVPEEFTDDGKIGIARDLRILDPSVVRIVDQDVKKPNTKKLSFYDLSQPKKKASNKAKAPKRGRGKRSMR